MIRVPLLTATIAVVFSHALWADDLFVERIEPLLKQYCYECHSHASGKMKGGLTLDSRSGWAEGGESGPAIVPGEPEKSLLVSAIRHESLEMPPTGRLADEQITDVVRWIHEGAKDPRSAVVEARPSSGDWWSLKPLVRPEIPASIKGARNQEIDLFIRQKLDRHSIEPSPEADRRTLLTRLSFDLIGLPPSIEELETFERDDSPDAVSKKVDELLASPHYGERWARHWLDTIHFAETHGYEHDLPRDHAWRYRDYVIESFNRDTPWGRFIREQLAADHFFPEEPLLMRALGFLGAGTFDHSSYNTAPITFEYLDRDDLVTQTMAAFTSTTANCARCHAHKFDPISQEDYYALQSVFAGIIEGNVGFDEDLSVAADRRRWQSLLTAAATKDSAVLLMPEQQALTDAWEKNQSVGAIWEPLVVESVSATDSTVLSQQFDGVLVADGPRPEKDTYTVTTVTSLETITAVRLDLLSDASLPMGGPGRQDNGNLHLSEFEVHLVTGERDKDTASKGKPLVFRGASADFDQSGWTVAHAIDGNPATAWGIYPSVGQSHRAIFEFEEALAMSPHNKLIVSLKQLHGGGHLIGRWTLSATSSPRTSLSVLPQAIEAILRIPPETRSQDDKVQLAALVVNARASEAILALPAQLMVYAAAKKAGIVLAVGGSDVRDVGSPKKVSLLHRGDFDTPMADASPGALEAVDAIESRFVLEHPDRENERRGALADWIAHPDNPLSWRSCANRVWQHHMGRGICDTPSDFGRMGGMPSHPELLDWLACELRDSGGSLKHLHRLILSSDTYRQQSHHRADAEALDADNYLLWRMNRQRLDAESYRDTVLYVSNRLSTTMGGVSEREFVSGKPVQLTPTIDYESYDWTVPHKHRRSIYRFVWRGIPDPFMESLDFPDLGLLAPTRGFSASSLQSLSLYNNAFVLSCSESAAAAAGNIRSLVRNILRRDPSIEESQEFHDFVEKHSLSALARILLNSNEFLFID